MNNNYNQISDLELELEQEIDFLQNESEEVYEVDDYDATEEYLDEDEEMDNLEAYLDDEDSEMNENWFEESENNYAERFYELSLQEFEFESDLDDEINSLMNEMEQEYFWKRIKNAVKVGKNLYKKGRGVYRKGRGMYRKGRRFVNRVKKNPLFNMIRKVSSPFDAFKKISSFLPASLRPMLANLAKTGLASFVPGGAAALPILQGLGFGLQEMEMDDPEINKAAWQNFTDVAERSFELLMDHEEGDITNPLQASKIAGRALTQALREKGINPTISRSSSKYSRSKGYSPKIVTVRPGEQVTVKVSRL